MPELVREFRVIKEHSLTDAAIPLGNGRDQHIPLGLDDGSWTLLAVDITEEDWALFDQIVDARLYLLTTSDGHSSLGDGYHAEMGGSNSARLVTERITAVWEEGEDGSEGHWVRTGLVYPGPSVTTSGSGQGGEIASTTNTWRSVPMAAIVEAWAPAAVKRRNGDPGGAAANLGMRLRSRSTSDSIEFWGRRAPQPTRRPYLRIRGTANRAPDMPVVTSPEEDDPAVVASYEANDLSIAFNHSDTEGHDVARAQVQLYRDDATDATPGDWYFNIVLAPGQTITVSSDPVTTFSLKRTTGQGQFVFRATGSHSFLPARTNIRYRLRVMDDPDRPATSGGLPLMTGKWSAWTELEDGRVFLAYKPRKPASPFMETTPEEPHVHGVLDSEDTTDYITAWGGTFLQDGVATSVTLWAPDIEIGGTSTRSDQAWAGSSLTPGMRVRWRHWHENRDGVRGDESQDYTTTIVDLGGPGVLDPLTTATKLLTRTPTFSITDDAAFDAYRYWIYRGDRLIRDSGIVTMASGVTVSFAIPSGVLNWGDGINGEMTWEAAIRPTGAGTWGERSPRRPFRIDSLPTATLTVSV